jgi:predicted N-acetyltransferase YhbS
VSVKPPDIRPEARGDEPAIREVTFAAFEPMPFSDGDEHIVVDKLRAASGLAISLVAEIGGRIVGHVAFSSATASDGAPGWYALGPVSVLPAWQRHGIGSSLIRRGLRELEEAGAAGCILVGNPGYYRRFDFALAPDVAPPGQPVEYFQLKLLCGPPPTGQVFFHAAFGGTA